MAGKQHERNANSLANLRTDFSHEERVENGRKGAYKTKEVRRRQKTFRDSVRALLACPVQDEKQRAALEALGLDPTMLNQIQVAVYGKATKGDTEAAKYLRDTAGERPRDALEIGNLDDKPLASMDLSRMTDDQLRALASRRAEEPVEGAEEA